MQKAASEWATDDWLGLKDKSITHPRTHCTGDYVRSWQHSHKPPRVSRYTRDVCGPAQSKQCQRLQKSEFGHDEMEMALLEWAEERSIWAIPNKPLFRNGIIVEICTLVRVEKLERNPDLLWLSLNPAGLSLTKPEPQESEHKADVYLKLAITVGRLFSKKTSQPPLLDGNDLPSSMAVNPTYPKHCEGAIFFFFFFLSIWHSTLLWAGTFW